MIITLIKTHRQVSNKNTYNMGIMHKHTCNNELTLHVSQNAVTCEYL